MTLKNLKDVKGIPNKKERVWKYSQMKILLVIMCPFSDDKSTTIYTMCTTFSVAAKP